VLTNRVTISLSKSGGYTCATRYLHLKAYSLMLSLFPLTILDKLCDVLKIKENRKRQESPWRLRRRYK
jgi:hypothetical protein